MNYVAYPALKLGYMQSIDTPLYLEYKIESRL